MSTLTPHEQLDKQLEKYKKQLDELKGKLNASSALLKSDLEADIDEIEKMLANVRKHISHLGEIADDEWHEVESRFKNCWTDLSSAIKNAASKSSKH